jgi:hypothetical protein
MGVSTDGILVFGFLLEEEGELDHLLGLDGDEFDDFVAKEAGSPEYKDDMTDEERSAWYNGLNAAVDACPVEPITHCSYDYPLHIISIRGTENRAARGYPVEVELNDPSPEKIAAAKEWCEKYGIPWQEPKWYLASLWG